MSLINSPPNFPVDVIEGNRPIAVFQGWRNFFVSVYNICNALTMSGTTAQRPTTLLWAGRMYFDISLGSAGKPVWRNKANTGWVLADGTAA